MKTYIHGTSYENALDIFKNGFKSENKDMIWECSNSNMLYVRNRKDEYEDEDNLFLAIEAGQIAAAKLNSFSTKIGIIEIEMSDEISENCVSDDTSCENMYGCFEINIDELNKYIKKGEASAVIYVYENAYIPYLRPFYLTGVKLSYMNIKDALLLNAIDVINSSKECLYFEGKFPKP